MTIELSIKFGNRWSKWVIEEVKRIEFTYKLGTIQYAIIETPYSCNEWGFEKLETITNK